jgi:hypothetical protein
VPWLASSDVDDGDQTLALIERWRADAARAQAQGQPWDPAPPAAEPPDARRAAPARSEPRARSLLGVLRALVLRR